MEDLSKFIETVMLGILALLGLCLAYFFGFSLRLILERSIEVFVVLAFIAVFIVPVFTSAYMIIARLLKYLQKLQWSIQPKTSFPLKDVGTLSNDVKMIKINVEDLVNLLKATPEHSSWQLKIEKQYGDLLNKMVQLENLILLSKTQNDNTLNQYKIEMANALDQIKKEIKG